MIKKSPLFLLVCLLAVAFSAEAFAGAWAQPQGKHYLKIWERSLIGSRAFGTDGKPLDVEKYQDHQLNFYGEYGLFDRLTLIAQGSPVGYASAGGENSTYVGPLGAGVRYGLLQSSVNLAVEGHYTLSLPVGDKALFTEIVEGQPVTYVPSLENHAGTLLLSAGAGVGSGWVTASIGFQANSNEDLDPAIIGSAQYGYRFNETWLADVHVNTFHPTGEIEVVNVPGVGQTSYVGFGFGASYAFSPNTSLAVGFDGAIAAKSNAATPSLNIGLEFQ